jgi:hypothetical protein
LHSNYNSAGKKHARQEEVGDVNSRKKTFFTRWTFYSKNYLHLIPSDIIEVEEGICGCARYMCEPTGNYFNF